MLCAYPGQDFDAVGRQGRGRGLGGLGLLHREQSVAALDDRDLHAEAGHDLGKLKADGAAAEDQQRARQGLGLDGLAVRPIRRAGKPVDRRDDRGRARGDDDAPARHPLLLVDLDPARPGDRRAAAHEVAALAGEAIDGDLVVPGVGGLLADPAGDRRPVGLDLGRAGEPGDAARLGERVAGADHHLGRDASPVGTLAADQGVLDADDAQAGLREPARDLFATDAQADDHHIHLLRFAHGTSFPPSADCRRVPCAHVSGP